MSARLSWWNLLQMDWVDVGRRLRISYDIENRFVQIVWGIYRLVHSVMHLCHPLPLCRVLRWSCVNGAPHLRTVVTSRPIDITVKLIDETNSFFSVLGLILCILTGSIQFFGVFKAFRTFLQSLCYCNRWLITNIYQQRYLLAFISINIEKWDIMCTGTYHLQIPLTSNKISRFRFG